MLASAIIGGATNHFNPHAVSLLQHPDFTN
jgi:hypothetical protein